MGPAVGDRVESVAPHDAASHHERAPHVEATSARAWLAQLATAGVAITPQSVAAALQRCRSVQLRHAILHEINARWGHAGVQQTLAAERGLVDAEHAQPDQGTGQPPAHKASTPAMRASAEPRAPVANGAARQADTVHAAPLAGPVQAAHSTAPADAATAIERARVLAQLGRLHLHALQSVLLPSYRRAVAATDTAAVRALILQLVGGVAHVVDAQDQIVRLVPQADASPRAANASTTDTDPFEPDASALAALLLDKAALDGAVATALPDLAVQVSPQMLGDQPTSGAIEPVVGKHALERFVYEAELVLKLFDEADAIQALAMPEDTARGTSEPASDAARAEAMERVARWRSRPINFLFLARLLTQRGIWQSLQGAKDLRGESPAELERNVSAQAAETGTTADVGSWDPIEAQEALAQGGPEWLVTGDDAMAVFERLAQVEPRARAGLVKQLHRMGLLARLCETLPWGLVKQLWESIDDPEASQLLEPYWTNRGGGESLGKMLDKRWYTRPLNTAMDITTLGAKQHIDAAYDAREAGLISDDDYWHAVDKAVGRAAFVGVAMAATGGVAGAFAGGAAEGLGAGASAIIGTATAGAVGSLGGHFAGDVYDQVLDQKHGFDTLAQYATSFAAGGLVGAIAAPIGLAASKYLPQTMRTMAQQAAAAHPQLTRILEAARVSGVGVATQVRMTVREFIESMRSGGPPGFRLQYATDGAAIPAGIASADPASSVVLTVRPLQDLNAPAPMRSDAASEDLLEVEHVSLADQVSEHFDDVGRHASTSHRPDGDGSFAGEGSVLGEGAAEAHAVQIRRSKRDAGVVEEEGQLLTDQHHVFPRAQRQWFKDHGMDIDDWCVDIATVEHQAQHGGGSWKIAREAAKKYPDAEWSAAIMKRLQGAEARKQFASGNSKARLTAEEIIEETRLFMERRGLGSLRFERYQK